MMGAVLGEGSVAGRGGHCGGQQGGAGIGLLSFSTLPLWSHHYHYHYIIANLRKSDSSLHFVFFGTRSVSLREKPSQKKHPFFWASVLIFVSVPSPHFSILMLVLVRLSFLFFIVISLCFTQRIKKTKKSYNTFTILSLQPICVSSNFLKIIKSYPRLALASRGETSQTLSGTSASAGWTSSSPAAKNLPMYLPMQWIFWT